MASRRPKLPPEITAPPPSGEQPARRVHVHVVPMNGCWAIRVGRRIEKTFPSQLEASKVAIPLARERGSRLFVHYESGVIREAGTSKAEEMLLEMWEMVYNEHNNPEPKAKPQPKAVHVVREKDEWGIRVGRELRRRFADRGDAVQAAMPYARKLGARLFVHFENGEVRESSTSKADEMMFKLWKSAYEGNADRVD